MKWNICLGWSTTLLCQSFAVRFWFFTSMVCRRKSRSALTSLSHYYLFEILLFKIYIKFFIFWEVYLSLDCVRGIPYLNFLPCPGFCHLTVIYNVFLVHSFCEIALIPCQPYSSWGRAFLLWWVSFGRHWAPMRCHCPLPVHISNLKWDLSWLRWVDCKYLADEVLCC